MYQSPFYEGINSHTLWLDRYEELADPQYKLLVDWKEHIYLKKYFAYEQDYGVRQNQAINGWRLLYESFPQSAHFLIYRLEGNGVEEAELTWMG